MAKSKVTMSAAEITEKWGRKLKQSIPDIHRGIDAVTESPMEKAAASKDKMLQNITAAVQDGRWEAGLRKVNLQTWKANTKDKVQARLSQGVDGAQQKHQQFAEYLINTVNTGLSQVQTMPNMTLEDNIARMTAMVRHMHSNPYKRG